MKEGLVTSLKEGLVNSLKYFAVGYWKQYDTRHGVLTLFSLETYNLYSIASQLKRQFDAVMIGISPTGIQ